MTVIDLPEQPGGVAASDETVWLGGTQGLARIDETKSPPAAVPLAIDVFPSYLDPFAGGVWVSEFTKTQVTKLVC